MTVPFDPGYFAEPFATLCREFPGPDVYPPDDFRVEWGPVFHRGRLDGSARVLVVGQDPATSEAIARRILVGAAGQRVQGLLARLGAGTSYVMVNAFLYGVYGQRGGERHRNDPSIASYRERWFEALVTPRLEAVVALGSLADGAWQAYRARVGGRAAQLPYAHVRHPTWPESSSNGNARKLAESTRALLESWNGAIEALAPKLGTAVTKYGTKWQKGDLVTIPSDDLPPGLPAWMRSLSRWSKRSGKSASEKRATLVVSVPKDAIEPAPARPAAARVAPAEEEAAPAALGESPRVDADAVEALAAAGHPESGAEGCAVMARALTRYALRGRVVTMKDDGEVLEKGIVWVDGGEIVAVRPAGDAPPPGFEGVTPLDVGGTIYPGFMDLHNHLAYDLLSLWNVPAAYDNRDDWKEEATYDQLVKRPLSILRTSPQTLAAVCRYAECKSLFGGVTTTQGIRLAKANAAPSYFRGIVRNVESPDDKTLPRGESRMADVVASDVERFRAQLARFDGRKAALLLHLSEGYDEKARAHFTDLEQNGSWAISRALAGIHCVGLGAADFRTLASAGGSVVWSPMSNLLLYGRTADVAAAKKAGLRIGLGCDWSPSGSKNLLAEMKVAWKYRDRKTRKPVFTARDVVAMVTRVASEIVRWDDRLGTVEPKKLADLTVLSTRDDDPYENAVLAREADVRLVVVGGIPRYGRLDLMHELVTMDRDVEDVLVAGTPRTIDLESPDERVKRLPFTQAQAILADALQRLPDLEAHPVPAARLGAIAAGAAPEEAGWTLALDEIEDGGQAMRPLFTRAYPHGGPPRPVRPAAAAAAAKLETVPVPLDPATIADHRAYFDGLDSQRNLPGYVKDALRGLYEDSTPARRARGGKAGKPRAPSRSRPGSRREKKPRRPRPSSRSPRSA